MNKINNNLLTIYLILGIIIFGGIIFSYTTSELFSPRKEISIKLQSIRVIKNDYQEILKNDTAQASSTFAWNDEPEHDMFILVDVSDKTPYAKTSLFNIKKIYPPQTIEISDNTCITPGILKNTFTLILKTNNKDIEFPKFSFDEKLNLSNKKNSMPETNGIKVESIDKKVVVFIEVYLN